MGVGEEGRGVPIQLGLELVEDLLDGEGLVCEERRVGKCVELVESEYVSLSNEIKISNLSKQRYVVTK